MMLRAISRAVAATSATQRQYAMPCRYAAHAAKIAMFVFAAARFAFCQRRAAAMLSPCLPENVTRVAAYTRDAGGERAAPHYVTRVRRLRASAATPVMPASLRYAP